MPGVSGTLLPTAGADPRAFPAVPMVVTSRIVGHREMGFRLRAGFEHLTVADLSRDDRDAFARRWCALTERGERRAAAADELIRDIHSSERIERLTGNPMLLTTMALIKRKIGRLPQRRVDLYEKAVEVLLNWRSEVDAPLDPREALPQLEYLAHAMCADGTQRLREDQALALLRQVRRDYPQIHPLTRHSPEEFLALLERRTGLLIQSGHTRHKGRSEPVYEFRHLTLQEYLAGIALVQGHYRGRNKDQTLAQAIAPLAGQVGDSQFGEFGAEDTAVVESWREALRLCLASCNDDDVDAALTAILRPREGETGTGRPRAVLAALCLADEPNVSQAVAQEVLRLFAMQVGERDGNGRVSTSLDAAAMELAASRWSDALGEYLLDEFFQRESVHRWNPGGLYAMVREWGVPDEDSELSPWLEKAVARRLSAGGEREAVRIALTVMLLAYRGKSYQVPGMVDELIQRLSGSAPMGHAAAWALLWMNRKNKEQAWHPSTEQMQALLRVAANPNCDSEQLSCLSGIFREERTPLALDVLLPHLPNSPTRTRQAITEALGAIGSTRATDSLLERLQDTREDQYVRQATIAALARIGDPRAIDAILERLQDAKENRRIRRAAAETLGRIGSERAIESLRACLKDPDEALRQAALGVLAQTCEDEAERSLLSEGAFPAGPWLDPQSPITAERIAYAARRLRQPPEAIRARYQALAERFGLKVDPLR
jgi:HEAT repeat protein